MTLESLQTRVSDACLSDRRLDALELGELEGDALEKAERHLLDCARCSDRRALLAQAADTDSALMAQQPTFVPGRTRAEQPRMRDRSKAARVLPWLGGFAAAAAALIVVLRMPAEPEADLVRTKGMGSIGFFVRHGGSVRRGQSGEQVAPDDALRFVVTSGVARYVAVLSRDGAGHASVYYPNGSTAARVEAGVDRPLGASVVLDGVLGEERLFALACGEPTELAPLLAGLSKALAEPTWPASCTVERITLFKEASH